MSKDQKQQTGRQVCFYQGFDEAMKHGATNCQNSETPAHTCKCSKPVIPGNKCGGFNAGKGQEKTVKNVTVCPSTLARNPNAIRFRFAYGVSEEQLKEFDDAVAKAILSCPYNLDGNCRKR